jgi:hypothetical protein
LNHGSIAGEIGQSYSLPPLDDARRFTVPLTIEVARDLAQKW